MEPIFKERSTLFNPIFGVTFVPVFVIMGFIMIKGFIDHKISDIIVGLAAITITAIVFTFLILIKLDLTIDSTGISFTFKPLVRKRISYNWNDIESAQLLKVNPVVDFLGWGLKTSRKYGRGYLSNGNIILQIILKNGEKIAVSVLDPLKAQKYIPAEVSIN